MSTLVLPPIADHCAVIVRLSMKTAPPPIPVVKTFWNYEDADMIAIRQLLSASGWDTSLCDTYLIDTVVAGWQKNTWMCVRLLFLLVVVVFTPRQNHGFPVI